MLMAKCEHDIGHRRGPVYHRQTVGQTWTVPHPVRRLTHLHVREHLLSELDQFLGAPVVRLSIQSGQLTVPANRKPTSMGFTNTLRLVHMTVRFTSIPASGNVA